MSEAGGPIGPVACTRPACPQVTHPDATAIGDKLEDAQGLEAISNVEVGVVLALEFVESIGDEDNDDDDYIQQVIAILPVINGVHVQLHAELGAIDGHKEELRDLQGCQGWRVRPSLRAPESRPLLA